MKQISVKDALDELFKDIEFDTNLYKKILYNNIEFITKDDEFKHLFGGKLIGCYFVKYTMYNKNIFYNNIFNMDYDIVIDAIDKITTINKNFKIARDDINLVCFYIAHRFLSNKDLKKEHAIEYAKEILNYFNYRSLVLLSSNYFIYPISEEKAITLIEKLSNKYIIKKLKNWKEYADYRSTEYLNSKFYDLLYNFNKDNDIPNAISDLFNRTKDTLKNIYREFLYMNEHDDIIQSKKNVVSDVEGKEIIIDKIGTYDKYLIKIENMLSDSTLFIKKPYINVTIDIIESISYKQMEEFLKLYMEYNFASRDNNNRIISFTKDILINFIDYLHKNSIFINNKTNIISVINTLVGNVLYARGTDISISKLKDEADIIISDIYKYHKKSVGDRFKKNIRNAFFVYIVILSLID